jgi:hypothetical protein
LLCSRRARLKGGFTVEVREARKEYICFYCRKPIRAKHQYVALCRFGSEPERYHIECFNRVMPHRVVVMVLDGEPEVCYTLEDCSVF